MNSGAAASARARPALFLDRDGVVNEETGWVHRIEQVRFLPGLFALLRTAQRLKFRLVIVTNQSGIGRGYYTEADFHTLMTWMRAELAANDIHLDRIYFCPHHPEHGQGLYRKECADRKPGPGMLLRAAADLDLDLAASWLVGDRVTDMAAGKAAGLRHLYLLDPAAPAHADYRVVATLQEVEKALCEADPTA